MVEIDVLGINTPYCCGVDCVVEAGIKCYWGKRGQQGRYGWFIGRSTVKLRVYTNVGRML